MVGTTYFFNALRAAMPDLTNIATGREPRPPEVDKFRDGLKDLPKQFATRWKPEFFEQVKAL